jgi:uncharacterized membrane protein YfcA
LIDFTLIELLIFGLATGLVSGFFGVGGGMVLIPILLFAGFEMKEAVAISIMQMVFSSIFGSFLNVKKNKAILKNGIILGIGGFLGGLNSGFILSIVPSNILEYLFMFIVAFAIYRIFNTQVHENEEVPDNSVLKLIIIGFLVGLVAMSIGVGGAVLLTPILVSYLNYNLKLASSMGLFFVIFSSIAGFTSLSISGQMLFTEGFLVGIGSLLGVFIGIKIKNIVNVKSFKKYILILYILILISMIFKQF